MSLLDALGDCVGGIEFGLRIAFGVVHRPHVHFLPLREIEPHIKGAVEFCFLAFRLPAPDPRCVSCRAMSVAVRLLVNMNIAVSYILVNT